MLTLGNLFPYTKVIIIGIRSKELMLQASLRDG